MRYIIIIPDRYEDTVVVEAESREKAIEIVKNDTDSDQIVSWSNNPVGLDMNPDHWKITEG